MANDLLRSLFDNDAALHGSILKLGPVTAVIVGQDHLIVKVYGPRLLAGLGYAWPDEVIGEPVETFVPEPKREQHRGWFDDWMQNPQERDLREARPMTVRRKDGSAASVRISLVPFYLEDGEPLGKAYVGKPWRGGIAFVQVLK